MNIKQVKEKFTLKSLLSSLGHHPDTKKSKGNDLWYKSPFRPNENSASFHIDSHHDIYKDFGDSEKGGDIIWFAQMYLKNQGKGHSVSNALQWFDELDGGSQIHSFNKKVQNEYKKQYIKEAPYKILSDKEVFSKSLFNYLEQKSIPKELAKKYFRQIYFLNRKTNKKTYGLGFKTRAGGFDIRTAYGFKTMIGKKDITIVKGVSKGSEIDVFEGASDFLTYLTIKELETPLNDCLILNSANLYGLAADYIDDYITVRLWLDNDKAGLKFEKALVQELSLKLNNLSVFKMNNIYEGFKDLNAWHIDNTNSSTYKQNALLESPMLVYRSLNKDSFKLSSRS